VIQITAALIKSKGRQHTGLVFASIIASHFVILRATRMDLTDEQIDGLYAEHAGRPYYADLRDSVAHGVVAIAMQHPDAVRAWRSLMGPTNPRYAKEQHIRYQARDADRMADNIVHGSDSPEAAIRELSILFGAHWVHANVGTTMT
jgi:nucleoside-diphosphate kinase